MNTLEMPLNVEVKETAPCQKQLRVEVPPERVDEEFDAVYQELRRVARVPGFRVGFAPRDLLERYHGEKAREEVLKRLIGRSLEEALGRQEKWDVIGRPEISEAELFPHQPFTYLAKLEVAPEVPLSRYRGLKLIRPKIPVTDEAVAQVLSRLQEQQAQLKPVLEPRASQEGDFLLVDLTERKETQAPVLQRDVVIHLELDEKKDPEGILKQLVGMAPPEKRVIALKDGRTLTVELKGIKEKELLPLDDTFAQSVGPFGPGREAPKTLEELKRAICNGLQEQAELSERQILEGQATHHLLEGWNFEVPPSLVGSQARRILKEKAVELMSQGVLPDQVEAQVHLLTDQAKLDALRQVKLFFILRRIAAAEGISATQEEVQAKVQHLAKRLGRSLEETQKELESRGLLEELIWSIIRHKVIDLVIREAEPKEGGADAGA